MREIHLEAHSPRATTDALSNARHRQAASPHAEGEQQMTATQRFRLNYYIASVKEARWGLVPVAICLGILLWFCVFEPYWITEEFKNVPFNEAQGIVSHIQPGNPRRDDAPLVWTRFGNFAGGAYTWLPVQVGQKVVVVYADCAGYSA
jgi:hypothetical protein